jgi:hypothetical protein
MLGVVGVTLAVTDGVTLAVTLVVVGVVVVRGMVMAWSDARAVKVCLLGAALALCDR